MNWRGTIMPLGTSTPASRGVEPFTAMQRELNRVFDDLWRGSDSNTITANFGTSLRMDVKETEQAFTIQAECPGSRKRISISVSATTS